MNYRFGHRGLKSPELKVHLGFEEILIDGAVRHPDDLGVNDGDGLVDAVGYPEYLVVRFHQADSSLILRRVRNTFQHIISPEYEIEVLL